MCFSIEYYAYVFLARAHTTQKISRKKVSRFLLSNVVTFKVDVVCMNCSVFFSLMYIDIYIYIYIYMHGMYAMYTILDTHTLPVYRCCWCYNLCCDCVCACCDSIHGSYVAVVLPLLMHTFHTYISIHLRLAMSFILFAFWPFHFVYFFVYSYSMNIVIEFFSIGITWLDLCVRNHFKWMYENDWFVVVIIKLSIANTWLFADNLFQEGKKKKFTDI